MNKAKHLYKILLAICEARQFGAIDQYCAVLAEASVWDSARKDGIYDELSAEITANRNKDSENL